jgi:ABC-type nitrate/sulfonate/bicarbonate transport system permease component
MPRLRLPESSYGLLALFAALAALEVVARAELISSSQFPPVSEMFRAIGAELPSATFWSDVARTVQGWGVGLVAAFTVAVPLGVLIGSNALVYRSLRVPIEFLRPIPSVALIPLVVLTLGTGLESKIFLVAFAAFWPLFMQTMYGVQDSDPLARDTARVFRVGPVARFALVTLAGAAPYVATGLRVASSIALVLAITTELLIGVDGLGRSISIAQQSGAVELTYALVVVTGILGWVLNSVFARVERRVLRWHSVHRRAEAKT